MNKDIWLISCRLFVGGAGKGTRLFQWWTRYKHTIQTLQTPFRADHRPIYIMFLSWVSEIKYAVIGAGIGLFLSICFLLIKLYIIRKQALENEQERSGKSLTVNLIQTLTIIALITFLMIMFNALIFLKKHHWEEHLHGKNIFIRNYYCDDSYKSLVWKWILWNGDLYF